MPKRPKDENDPLGLVELAKVLGEIEGDAAAPEPEAEPVSQEDVTAQAPPDGPDATPSEDAGG